MDPIRFDDPAALARWRDAYRALKHTRKLRQRDAAAAMRVSEAQAVAAFVGVDAVRLRPDFAELIARMPRLGPVMTLTRNEAAVHEKEGVFEKIGGEGDVVLVLGTHIDLRIFHRQWAFGFAVREAGVNGAPNNAMKSFQFYNGRGEAAFKIYLRLHSDHAAFEALLAEWTDPDQSCALTLSEPAPAAAPRPSGNVDLAGFHAGWEAMTDTHDFFPLLRRFELTRTQALHLAEPRYVARLADGAIDSLLNEAARSGVPIMVFVGNRDVIQIHTGPVKNIHVMGPWLNVLDDGFNLHVRTDLVASAWLVRKPTRDGIVTSVELFDAAGENIAMLFGARKPGSPELAAWRALAESLPRRSEEVAA